MIYELSANEYEKARPVMKGIDHALAVDAVIDGICPGSVYVDDVDRPRTLFAATPEGHYLVGYEENEAKMRGWSMEQTKKNLAFSRKMWSMPESDWLAAYEEGRPVGTVRMAMTHEGIGVVDAFGLLEAYRGRGLGVHLLAGGLSCLAGKTDVIWQDVDHDNVPARRVYDRVGFQVHHHHGEMVMDLP